MPFKLESKLPLLWRMSQMILFRKDIILDILLLYRMDFEHAAVLPHETWSEHSTVIIILQCYSIITHVHRVTTQIKMLLLYFIMSK